MINPAQNPYTSSLPADPSGSPLNRGEIDQLIRVNQIITFALANGIVVITAVMGYLSWSNNEGAFKFSLSSEDMLFPLIGFVMVAATLPVGFIVKRVIFQQAKEQAARLQDASSTAGEEELVVNNEVMGRIATGTIISQAAAEGGAVANAILMMLGDNFIHLIPIAIALLAVIIQVPTYHRVCSWLRQ